MTKEQLHELAALGLQRKLAALEKDLAAWHRDFPDLFLSPTPPQLLKAEARKDAQPWPITVTKNGHQPRRPNGNANAKSAAMMRARKAAKHGETIISRARAYLKSAGPATIPDLAKALQEDRATVGSTLRQSAKRGLVKQHGHGRSATWMAVADE